MKKLFYLQCSPRGSRSYSISVADAFVESFRGSNPEYEIITKNIFTADLPTFDGLAVQAKYTILHGEKHTPEELQAWKAVEKVIEEFKSADKYVMAVPMWNFGIPYRLKQYIDILVQPGYTFSFSPEAGYQGLVTGKPMFIAFSRGGEYPAGTPAEKFDYQKTYLEFILGFIGITDVRSVVVEPTLAMGSETAKEKRTAAIEKAKQMAKIF
jgi:FMN-dependent NADH-azoreductase